MNSFLNKLAGYDPDKDSYGELKPKKKRTRNRTGGTELPDSVRTNVNTKWLEESYMEGESLAWKNHNGKIIAETDRPPRLIEAEIKYIEYEQADYEYLTLKKAAELKPYWAKEYSIGDCVKAFAHLKSGYSYSTIKKYWRIFNMYYSPID